MTILLSGWKAAALVVLVSLFGIAHLNVSRTPAAPTQDPALVVRHDIQIADLERRITTLENQRTAEQLAAIQTKVDQDHNLLWGMLFMMIPVGFESFVKLRKLSQPVKAKDEGP